MRRRSETLLLLPLLPIFIIGMFPMLLIGMMGYAGLAIFGILLVRVALAATMDAHSDFNQEIIAHGYAQGTRARRARLRPAGRDALCGALPYGRDRHDRCRHLGIFLGH